MSKTCKKCGKKKEESSFYAAKGNTDGLRGSCKDCMNAVSSIYVAANKKNVALYKAKYHLENRAEINKYQENYRAENREQLNAKQKIYYAENTKSVAAYKERYYEANRDRLSVISAKYQKERKKTDPGFALKCRITTLISKALKSKGHTKNSRTSEILGCSASEFSTHIERQFTKGMTWANRSEWHLDHIIPISSAETEDEILSLNNYLNLRPMWAKENLKKSNSLIYLI